MLHIGEIRHAIAGVVRHAHVLEREPEAVDGGDSARVVVHLDILHQRGALRGDTAAGHPRDLPGTLDDDPPASGVASHADVSAREAVAVQLEPRAPLEHDVGSRARYQAAVEIGLQDGDVSRRDGLVAGGDVGGERDRGEREPGARAPKNGHRVPLPRPERYECSSPRVNENPRVGALEYLRHPRRRGLPTRRRLH